MEKGFVILDLAKRNQWRIFGDAMYFSKRYRKLTPTFKAQVVWFSKRTGMILIVVYLMRCFTGKKAPIHLIRSSDKPGLDLLKVEYVKVYTKLLKMILKAFLHVSNI